MYTEVLCLGLQRDLRPAQAHVAFEGVGAGPGQRLVGRRMVLEEDFFVRLAGDSERVSLAREDLLNRVGRVVATGRGCFGYTGLGTAKAYLCSAETPCLLGRSS
jgi:hypothetical protein